MKTRATLINLTLISIAPVLLAGALAILSLGGLCVPAFLAGRGYENLLLTVPAEPGSPQLDVSKIEQFCKDEFLLSYEIPEAAKAGTPRGEYPVTLIGTNSAYPRLLGFPLREGAFFSRHAWEGKRRLAVLNEKAARRIFGGANITGGRFRIKGETWIVSGVIADGDDENCRVYVPSSLRGGGAVSLLALMDRRRGTGAASVKNGLKALGIREGAFAFYNLETQSRLLGERVLAALGVFAGLLLLCLSVPLGAGAAARIAALRQDARGQYLGELLSLRRKDLGRCALLVLALAAALVLALLLARALAALCLPWRDIPALGELNRDFFSLKLEPLRREDLPSRILFALSLGSSALFGGAVLRAVLSKN